MINISKTSRYLIASCALSALGVSAATAQNLIYNGNFEQWDSVSGTPPMGVPTGWYVSVGGSTTGASVVQSDGLTAGSNYSATLYDGSGNVAFVKQLNGAVTVDQFTMSFDFEATSGTDQTFRLNLIAGDGSTVIQAFKTSSGSSAGLLNLQTYAGASGGGWVTLFSDFNAGVYDSATGVWTTSSAYSFSMTADYDSDLYSITFGPTGGIQTTLSDLSYFYNGTGSGTNSLGRLYFLSSADGHAFALDNIGVYETVPEPSSLSLALVTGLGLFLMTRKSSAGRQSADV